ncbi:hypothetical protein FGB62_115g017 [Gracilaria domingensis]|nr:hypothetical protein FGB62_115g017 [Gracilaria domingensis]
MKIDEEAEKVRKEKEELNANEKRLINAEEMIQEHTLRRKQCSKRKNEDQDSESQRGSKRARRSEATNSDNAVIALIFEQSKDQEKREKRMVQPEVQRLEVEEPHSSSFVPRRTWNYNCLAVEVMEWSKTSTQPSKLLQQTTNIMNSNLSVKSKENAIRALFVPDPLEALADMVYALAINNARDPSKAESGSIPPAKQEVIEKLTQKVNPVAKKKNQKCARRIEGASRNDEAERIWTLGEPFFGFISIQCLGMR